MLQEEGHARRAMWHRTEKQSGGELERKGYSLSTSLTAQAG